MRNDLLLGAMTGLLAVSFGFALGNSAVAQDAATGRALAERWCAECHAVAPDSGDSDVVPAFQRIARERQFSEASLTVWLSQPHLSMPSLSLTRQETADLTAYFDSLRETN